MKGLELLIWNRTEKLGILLAISKGHPEGNYTETLEQLVENEKKIQIAMNGTQATPNNELMTKQGNTTSIATTSKKEFLKAEYKDTFYTEMYNSYEEYKKSLIHHAWKCKTCKVYYWEGCKKRCQCN